MVVVVVVVVVVVIIWTPEYDKVTRVTNILTVQISVVIYIRIIRIIF